MVTDDGKIVCDWCNKEIDQFDIMTGMGAKRCTVPDVQGEKEFHTECEWLYIENNCWWYILAMAC